MHSNLKRAAAAALALCMGVSAMTGCSKKAAEDTSSKPMVKVGDLELSQGTSNLIMRYQQAQFESGWGGFLRSYYGGIWDVDLTGSGQPYSVVFIEQVANMLEQLLLAKEHMADYGVEVTEEETAAIKKAAEEFIAANNEETLGAISATVENAEEMLTLYTIRSKVEAVIADGVDTEVADEEAAQRTVAYASFIATVESEEEAAVETEAEAAETEVKEAVAETEVKTKSAAETEEPAEAVDEAAVEAVETEAESESEDPAMIEAREIAKAKAEAFLADVKDADDFEAAAAEAAQEDHINSGTWTFGKDDTYPDAAIIAATEGLEDGTLVDQVFQTGNVYYVVYVTDAFDEEATQEKKEEIVEERKSDAIEAVYTDWANAEDVDFDTEALASYSFNTLVYVEQETEEEAVAEEVESETGEMIVK